jgi:hypothetical protein
MGELSTDFLVVGAGALGLAFTDTLVQHCDATVTIVDRRHRAGGHWNDAYPFIRLHQPSSAYGVDSRRLGSDSVDASGPNAGFYERATAVEICEYFARVLDEDLLPTGRVRFLGMTDYVGGKDRSHRLANRLTGETSDVTVRRALVDARYLETQVPSTHTPSFEVGAGVRLIPVNGLVDVDAAPNRYVVIGSGKTSMDAVPWLFAAAVAPERIRWIRPRDAWMLERANIQPHDQVASIMEGMSLDAEAVAEAESEESLFDRLEDRGRLYRLDKAVTPTMFRCAITSAAEREQMTRVTDVVRLGRVRRIEPTSIRLDGGSVAASPDDLYVDCSATGISDAPSRPIFEDGRITLQQVRQCQPCFNAALTGYVAATRDDVAEQNRLCPTTPYPSVPHDWIRIFRNSLRAFAAWQATPDVNSWVGGTRLNLSQAVPQHLDEPRMQESMARFGRHLPAATAKLEQLVR